MKRERRWWCRFFYCKFSYQLLVDSNHLYFRPNRTRLVVVFYVIPVKNYHRPRVSCLFLLCNASDDGDFFSFVKFLTDCLLIPTIFIFGSIEHGWLQLWKTCALTENRSFRSKYVTPQCKYIFYDSTLWIVDVCCPLTLSLNLLEFAATNCLIAVIMRRQ